MANLYKWLGIAVMAAGAGLLIWQSAGSNQTEERQQSMMEGFAAMRASPAHASEAEQSASSAEAEEAAEESYIPPDGIENMEGILMIPGIDLRAPVMYGADAQTLNQTLGAIEHMDKPGELGGSYAIAGHQAHVFGKFFNRLHELEIGNELTYQTAEEEIAFEVYDIQIVRPHEVDVLSPEEGMAKLSLITCYPEYSNEYRLVVQAKKVDVVP